MVEMGGSGALWRLSVVSAPLVIYSLWHASLQNELLFSSRDVKIQLYDHPGVQKLDPVAIQDIVFIYFTLKNE